jgi:O-antigen/teichoic acid export membrane protein
MLRSVVRKAGWLGVGIAGGQGIILLSTPLLSRLHEPAEFGSLAMFLVASNIAIATGTGRYDLAIASSDRADIAPLTRLCILISCLAGFGVMSLISLMSAVWPNSKALIAVDGQILMLGICFFFSALSQTMTSVMLRREQAKRLAFIRLFQGICFSAFAFSGYFSLSFAHTISSILPLLFLSSILPNNVNRGSPTIISTARKYKTFFKHGLPGAIFDVVGYSVCIWVVVEAYGVGSGGEWSQVQRLIGGPVMVFSIAIGQVLLVHTSANIDDRAGLEKLFKQIMFPVTIIGVTLTVIMAFAGQSLFAIILGENWQIASGLIAALTLAVFVRAAVSPLSSILVAKRRLDLALKWQSLYFVSAATTFALVAHHLSLTYFAIFYAGHEIVLYILYLRLIMRTLKG